jgi:uncharacterized protein YoxC
MSKIEELKEMLEDTEKLLKDRTEILKSVMKQNDELLKKYKDLSDDIYFYKKELYVKNVEIRHLKIENEELKKLRG